MRYRQVHLDFHTSEAIENVGVQFSAEQFQAMLQQGHVDSITVFSKCHHGWAYHPSDANEIHPHLTFDLLGAQIAAAHAIGVNTPVYLSAGLDEKEARRHPEWLLRDQNDRTNWSDSFLKPGYHQFCMNTPYLDILCAQIEEVVQRYDADGIFLDIVGVRDCCCRRCIDTMLAAGEDPLDPSAVRALGERVYAEYARRTNDAVHRHKPGLPVFHNGGHITRGRRDWAHFNTHIELESLPTGGWGYDHFPMSARYVATLGMDYLGMTGKFHTTWGEFGGYKHPNALRYEAALNLAMGARVSVGDQLDPSGKMDDATYALIGAAYAEVEQKEPWCGGSRNIADVAVISQEASLWGAGADRFEPGADHGSNASDAGAVRILLEGKFLFDLVDLEQDLLTYKVAILPDSVRITQDLQEKLRAFCAAGGKVLATGQSGLNETSDTFALDLGAVWQGVAAYHPSYLRPTEPLANLGSANFVIYAPYQDVTLSESGTALASRQNPLFNRAFNHFSSHQHAPSTGVDAGPAITEGADGIYIAWRMFEEYATVGSLAAKQSVMQALNRLLGDRKTLQTSLPAQGIVTLTRQDKENRDVLHLLYGSPVRRGNGVEVIEDLLPMFDTSVSIRVEQPVSRVTLAPQGDALPFTTDNGRVAFTVPRFECHQLVVLE